ncbi:Protein of unknown function [Amphibacillus marinus]|uniref:DUF1593 domain-containing protein n=1 Tax=Amphibacillus marinus TaxID=872970 RepID=A0A1H8L257_9BACI|nr:DUF1593 domain-containing protein [Amphibacillus marinus]SEN99181.1 Protein of unknown function [Amphibacillus marinus]
MRKLVTETRKKPRTVIMHDPELDDLNTVLRYLLYSNQFETEAFIYSSSRFHWKGDGQGTLYNGESEHTDHGLGPRASWRWDEKVQFIEAAIDAYAKCYPNLLIHAEGYPNPELLRRRIYQGNVAFPGEIEYDSPGSNIIKQLILDDNPEQLYLLTGTGQSTIGRALKAIAAEWKEAENWPAIYQKVSEKIIIQSFGDQDDVYRDYIAPNWPLVEFRQMATAIWGYDARRVALPQDQHYLSAAWTKRYVTEVGPLGALYHVWGDGRQMHQDDFTDFFGFKNVTIEEVIQLGYRAWYPRIEEAGSWISEGDTSMFMNLIDNGLDAHLDASYGGWGGRNDLDIAPDEYASKDYASARWFGYAQRDFAARLQWSVTANYQEANHHPKISLAHSAQIAVSAGETVVLTALAEDPDGDHLTGRWWHYAEPSTYPGKIKLLEETGASHSNVHLNQSVVSPASFERQRSNQFSQNFVCKLHIPTDAEDDQTIHIILEVTDFSEHHLTTFKRFVLTVNNK